jgi:hypothetical protein
MQQVHELNSKRRPASRGGVGAPANFPENSKWNETQKVGTLALRKKTSRSRLQEERGQHL